MNKTKWNSINFELAIEMTNDFIQINNHNGNCKLYNIQFKVHEFGEDSLDLQ